MPATETRKPNGDYKHDLEIEKEYDRQIERLKGRRSALETKIKMLDEEIRDLERKQHPFKHRRTHAEFYWGDL